MKCKCYLLLLSMLLVLGGFTELRSEDTQAVKKVLWLSDLDLSKMTVGWDSAIADQSIVSNPLTIAGHKYEKGVGSHANSIMYIDLHGQASRFKAQVGLDDETQGKGSICFRVYGDGRKLFDSGVVRGNELARQIDIDLKGIETLILLITDAGDNIHHDHGDWANAFFEYSGTAPLAIDVPVDKKVILTPKPGPSPKINGPKVYGARPGKPFIYRIPATGKRPMDFSVQRLPQSLRLDEKTGIITGRTPKEPGEYAVVLRARNSYGKDERTFKIVAGDTLALTPPMGWNSWYIHYYRVTDADMRAAADVMIESGMADFGYQYVNIDDCWSKKRGDTPYRDDDGTILPNDKFPDMKALTDYIHSKGLKAGTYTSPGPWNCAGYTGSFDHELQDAVTFAEWGFDFLKYDWCSYRHKAKNRSIGELAKPYEKMGDILKQMDRDVVLNLCQYGMGEVWKWGGKVGGHCWRTTGDLGLLSGYLEVGFRNARHYEYAKPGQWNDPDYILIGWVGNAHSNGQGIKTSLTSNQQYQYMSMWSLMASPLIFSGDMTKLDDFTINVLCNAEVIDVNQDQLGKQGRIIKQTEDMFVMVKDLEDGSKAVGLFNTTEVPINIEVTWAELGIKGKYRVRDLWRQKDVGVVDKYSAKVGRHGVMMIRLFPNQSWTK
jgi:alpha-galactosidase